MAQKIMVLRAENFHLAPDRKEIFRWLGCSNQLPAFDAFQAAWPEALSVFCLHCAPICLAALGSDGWLTVFFTVGAPLEQAVDACFDAGAYAAASLVNLMADQALFQMDMQAGPLLEKRCAAERLYIAARREAPMDYPLERQIELFEPFHACLPDVSVSPSGIFRPAKSMLYRLQVTPNAQPGQAGHDCSRCEKHGCPYRGYRK